MIMSCYKSCADQDILAENARDVTLHREKSKQRWAEESGRLCRSFPWKQALDCVQTSPFASDKDSGSPF